MTADQGGDKVADVTSKLFEFSLKTGAELMQSPDDIFQAAIKIFGKTVVGNSLSKLSATQCAGLIGVVVSTLAPQVQIDHLQFSIDHFCIIRQQFQFC